MTILERYIEALKYDWQFSRGEIPYAAHADCGFPGWKTVRVPHDYAIDGPFDPLHDKGNTMFNADGTPMNNHNSGRTGALPLAGTAWYRRALDIRTDWRGKRISLEFDGIMSHCEIFINGVSVGKNMYGYTSFEVDITGQVRFGEQNLLAIRVWQESYESRWYQGAGIYRNARLVVREETAIAYHTVFLTTPVVTSESATVALQATITKPQADTALSVTIIDREGNTVASEAVPACGESVTLSLTVEKPQLWANGSPYLYSAVLELKNGNGLLDNETIPFGIRTLEFHRDKGFFVNGVFTKLKGVCLHHDMGVIGTAVNDSALRRQLRLLAEMGCNAIRTSHNPPAPELLTIADEMGFYVIVEQFDQWKYSKTPNGYGLYFDEWAEYDFTATLRRDRNHPSVIMWSLGNEVEDQHMDNKGGKTTRFLADIAHREDPTRPTTAGFNYYDDAMRYGMCDAVDIVGWNYIPFRYKLYHETSSWGMYGSETASCLSSRGFYRIPPKKSLLADRKPVTTLERYEYAEKPWQRYDNVELYVDMTLPIRLHPEPHVPSYDLAAPGWGYFPEVEFAAQDDLPYIFGEFAWTGFDYLGEPTPYRVFNKIPRLARSSYFGIIDLAGLPKDRFYSYQAKWANKEVLHLFPHWNWNEGDVLPVHCYTSYDRAELLVNGKSYGIREKKPGSDNVLERYRLIWQDVAYEPGELTVRALDKDGGVLKTETIRTAGEPAMLALSLDRECYTADGDDLCYVTVKVLDKDGNLCPKADTRLHFSCEGCGEYLASDNGDQTDLEIFASTTRKAFSGMAVGIFRTLQGKAGELHIRVRADGMADATIIATVQ